MKRYLILISLFITVLAAAYGAYMVTFVYAPLSNRWFNWVSIGCLWVVAAAAIHALYVQWSERNHS